MKTQKKRKPKTPSEAAIARDRQMLRQGLMTPTAAAAWSRVPQQTIYTWIRKGKLKPERVGPKGPKRRIYVSTKELKTLLGPGALAQHVD